MPPFRVPCRSTAPGPKRSRPGTCLLTRSIREVRMRIVATMLCVLTLAACTSVRRSPPLVRYATPAAGLDCAENVLERSGYQVQGDDVGARSYERMVPGRRDTVLLARQNNGITGEFGYVRVVATLGDSAKYLLRTTGVTTRVDGTDTPSLLHEQGVNAVLTKCGAIRLIGP